MNPHRTHPATLVELGSGLWRYRSLVYQLAKRDVLGRYRGSYLGVAWSFFTPLIMLAVYTFVFSVVFKARWEVQTEGGGQANFAVVLFVGMVLHGLFAEVANRAPRLILDNVAYVKRVVFPLDILPWVVTGSALFHLAVNWVVLSLAVVATAGHLAWTSLLFPVIVAPLVAGTMGFAWLLASLGVFFRDVGQTIGIVTTIMMFLAPVFYPVSALPEGFQALLHLNPLTFPIEESRKVILLGEMPNWLGLAGYYAASITVAWAGFWWFQKTRKGFADVV